VCAGTRQPLAHPGERVTPLSLDVTSAAQIQAAARQAGSLDILVNHAGLGLYDDLSDRGALEKHLAVNLFGTYGVTQAFPAAADPGPGRRRQRPVGDGPGGLAVHPGRLDLQWCGQGARAPVCGARGGGTRRVIRTGGGRGSPGT